MPAVYSVEVGTAKPGEGAPRRSTLSADKLLTTPEAGIETIFDVVQRSVRLFGDQPALGYRDILHVHTETKQVQKTDSNGEAHSETKTWKYFECSDYKYWSYKTLGDKVKAASSGMANLGLNKDTLFNVYAATSHHWQLMAWACSCQSITFCTSYDSLGEEGLIHSLNEPEVVGVFTNADLLPMLLKVLAQTPTVKYIIYDGDRADSSLVDQLAQTRDGVRVITLDELLEDGQRNPKEYVPPKSEDTACIMYTCVALASVCPKFEARLVVQLRLDRETQGRHHSALQPGGFPCVYLVFLLQR
jgi:long-chain acyl-CoA synthetase